MRVLTASTTINNGGFGWGWLFALVAAISAAVAIYMAYRRVRKEQKDARVDVLQQTNKLISANRDELQKQNREFQHRIQVLEEQVRAQAAALEYTNRFISAEESIKKLQNLMLRQFDEIKTLIAARPA